MKARELIVLERMNESNGSGNIDDSIRDNDDFKEGLMIAKAILKKGCWRGCCFNCY